MKKILISIFTLFLLNVYGVFAQKSPVKFLNNTCNINIDTTSYAKKIAYNRDLKYKFVNIGKHVTFIDKKDSKYSREILPYCITKPKDTNTLILKLENFSNSFVEQGFKIQKDTSFVLNVPFYYEGKIYDEKLTLNYTFGKSKLIEYDNPLIRVDDTIKNFYIDDFLFRLLSVTITLLELFVMFLF